jgi:serine/threonine protein kinase
MDSSLTPVVPSFGDPAPGGADHERLSMETLERYKLLARLAQGGMAEVYFAAREVAPFHHHPAVIKRLHPHLAQDPKLVQMFLDEARLLCKLEHPHIVRTLEAGIIDGQCCIAMEYLEGQPLQIVLRRAYESGQLSIALAVRIVASMLDALHYAHELGDESGQRLEIVHRDISPHNVFVTNSGDVKLLDFGIAKARTQEGSTATGMVKGKAGYIAPEQATAATVDRRADIWAVGVVLWEALTGRRLFKADSDAATILLTLTADIPSASSVRADVPEALDAILERALERDPDLRYQTAFEMHLELRDWLASAAGSEAQGALAQMMRATFALEIVEQRRFASMLIARSDCTPPSIRAVTTSSGGRGSTPPGERESGGHTSRQTLRFDAPTARRSFAYARPLAVATLFGTISAGVTLLVIVALHTPSSADRPGTGASGAVAVRSPESTAPPEETASGRVGSADLPRRPPAATPVTADGAASSRTAVKAGTFGGTGVAAAFNSRRLPAPAPGSKEDTKASSSATAAVSPAKPEDTSDDVGFLTIDTTPWSVVSMGGKVLGQTPLVHARLPSGVHLLSLRNSELGLETTYSVDIAPGKTVVRRIGIE